MYTARCDRVHSGSTGSNGVPLSPLTHNQVVWVDRAIKPTRPPLDTPATARAQHGGEGGVAGDTEKPRPDQIRSVAKAGDGDDSFGLTWEYGRL
jgi:hypothetical protein